MQRLQPRSVTNLVGSFFMQTGMLVWHLLWNVVALAVWWVPGCWDGKHYFFLARHCWAPGLLAICASPPSFVGRERVDWSQPHVIVANHQGNADVALLMMLVPRPLRFLAKRSVAWLPILGWILVLAGFPFVDRSRPDRTRASLRAIGERMIRERLNIVVFPEGTRSPEGVLLPFRRGAFDLAIRAQVPVVPVAIEGSGLRFPRHSFRIFPGILRVTVGDPIPTAGLGEDDAPRLAGLAEQRLLDLLDGWRRIEPEQLEQAREEDRRLRGLVEA